MPMSPWHVETDPKVLRRIGKTAEEASELAKVCNRIVIQGLSGFDPKSLQSNIDALTDEIADVQAQSELCIEQFHLDRDEIAKRVHLKKAQMAEWEALVAASPVEGNGIT